jgi:uncharacterized protein YjiS (DUF1127 family)
MPAFPPHPAASHPETEPIRPADGHVNMMNAPLFAETLRPLEAMQALVARHGFWKLLVALPVAALKQRRDRAILAEELSPHLLRDIGLGAHLRPGKSWELG